MLQGLTSLFALLTFPAAVVVTGAVDPAEAFRNGTVIEGFGKVAPVETDFAVPETMALKLSFDLVTASEGDEINRDIDKLARFINMHGEGGLEPRPVDLALVVHGRAVGDVTTERAEGANPNIALVEALLAQDVRIVVCGQSAAALGVPKTALIDGVEMATSAMTAHAVLQSQGYALNPF